MKTKDNQGTPRKPTKEHQGSQQRKPAKGSQPRDSKRRTTKGVICCLLFSLVCFPWFSLVLRGCPWLCPWFCPWFSCVILGAPWLCLWFCIWFPLCSLVGICLVLGIPCFSLVLFLVLSLVFNGFMIYMILHDFTWFYMILHDFYMIFYMITWFYMIFTCFLHDFSSHSSLNLSVASFFVFCWPRKSTKDIQGQPRRWTNQSIASFNISLKSANCDVETWVSHCIFAFRRNLRMAMWRHWWFISFMILAFRWNLRIGRCNITKLCHINQRECKFCWTINQNDAKG